MTKESPVLRKVSVQGALVRVAPVDPSTRVHAGGGRRGAQQGHTQRSARRMEYDLQTMKPPNLVVWLTTSRLQGPKNIRAHAKGFLGRVKRKAGCPIAAVIKLELQQRLSVDVGVALWAADEAALRSIDFQTIWEKQIKADGRVKVEEVLDWSKLASYLSKKIIVSASAVTAGRVHQKSASTCSG